MSLLMYGSLREDDSDALRSNDFSGCIFNDQN